jgi:ankyrin repeat protein
MKTIHSYSLSHARSFFCTFAAWYIAFLLLLTMATASAVSIHEAAKAGDAAAVRAILQTNTAAALRTNSYGETALHLGARAASPAVVEALLAAKASVNAQEFLGGTALQYAIIYPRVSRFADSLAEGGVKLGELFGWAWKVIANPETRTVGSQAPPVGATVMRRAVATQDDPQRTRAELKVVELLLAAGADVKVADLGGFTPLHCAAMRAEPEFLQAVLARGADV